MTWMMLNIPLAALFFALWAGIPMWLVLKRPDEKPTLASAPAVTHLPAREHREDTGYRRVA